MTLVGLTTGDPTSFDGKYVVSYDPSAWRFREVSSRGELEAFLGEFVTVSADVARARRFATAAEALEFWRQTGVGVRPWDGKPNRPLTAFHIQLSRAPDAPPPDVSVS